MITHGRDYLSAEEYNRCLKDVERRYFLYLSRCWLRGRNREFWEYHRNALASINYSLNLRCLGKWIPRALLEKTWETLWTQWDKRSCITWTSASKGQNEIAVAQKIKQGVDARARESCLSKVHQDRDRQAACFSICVAWVVGVVCVDQPSILANEER